MKTLFAISACLLALGVGMLEMGALLELARSVGATGTVPAFLCGVLGGLIGSGVGVGILALVALNERED